MTSQVTEARNDEDLKDDDVYMKKPELPKGYTKMNQTQLIRHLKEQIALTVSAIDAHNKLVDDTEAAVSARVKDLQDLSAAHEELRLKNLDALTRNDFLLKENKDLEESLYVARRRCRLSNKVTRSLVIAASDLADRLDAEIG